jgi:hypothetical protein
MMLSNNAKTFGKDGIFAQHLPQTVALILVLFLAGSQLFAENEVAVDPVDNQDQDGKADFSFRAPKGFLGFRIGRFFPEADSDLFDTITSELTIEKSDFRAWDFGVDGGANLHERVELIFSFDYMKRTTTSEFREFVDDNDLPITQTNTLEQIPLTGGIKFLFIPRGRRVGQYAWLPSVVVPYVGGGAGVLWYQFQQEGDFVDESTYEIFPAHLKSSGWTPTLYAGGGVDIHVFKSAFLMLDLRYVWAKPELNRDFVSFDALDLSGLRVSAGLQFHF